MFNNDDTKKKKEIEEGKLSFESELFRAIQCARKRLERERETETGEVASKPSERER